MCAVALASAAPLAAPASATALSPPTITKAFGPTGIQPNGISTVTFTIANPNAGSSLSGVAFTDNLPANLTVATPNGLTNNCSGTATATAGSGSISLSGGSLAGSASCTLTANVTSSVTGTYNNTAGAVSATESGTGSPSNTATLTVANPPTITKQFASSSVPSGGTTSVFFTINNPNSNSTPPNSDVTLTGVSFSDSLPAGMAVANPANASSDCGGTLTAMPGSSTITFSGGTIAPAMPPDFTGGNCNIAVEVQVTGSGTLNNTTGPVSAKESGAGTTSNTATVTVGPAIQPPTLAKQFAPASVAPNTPTTLTFTVANPNSATELVNISFNDPLPQGLQVSAPNGLTGTCVTDGGAVSATAGSGSISLNSLNLPASSSCTFSVSVSATSEGIKNNATGKITATYDDGSGTFVGITGGNATASLVVTGPPPPALTKSFGAFAIPPNGQTSLTFTLVNPSQGTPLTGVGFSDPLPGGLSIAIPSGLTGSCGGGTITAPAGGSAITVSGATLPPGGSCSFSVNVAAGSTEGLQVNTTSLVSSNEAGTGSAATATIYVARPPTLTAAFGAPSMTVGQTTSLTFVTVNPNSMQALTGLGFSALLPAGLVVASPSGASNGCGGGLAAAPGSSSITFAGGSLVANMGCKITVGVTATSAGTKTATTTAVTSNEGGSGNAASATIAVATPAGGTPPAKPGVKIDSVTIHHDGSTSLTIETSGPGAIDVLETAGTSHLAGGAAAPLKPGPGRFSFATKHVGELGAGKHVLRLKPGKRGKRLVRHRRGTVRLNVWVRFTPTSAGPVTAGRLHLRLP